MGGFDDMTAAEALRALADDWEYNFDDLYVNLRQGTEARWGVDCDDEGSVSGTLRVIADRACEEQGALRVFAERVHGMLWGEGWHPLDEIADRLGEELSELDRTRCHEPEELDDGGCYDGMVHPVDDEDYEAAVWVRDHGGLDAVRERLGERKRLVDRLRAYEDALDMMADSMGVDKSSDKLAQARRTRKAVKNLECRLMPEGMEWPRYDTGDQVMIGDTVAVEGGCEELCQVHLGASCYSLYTETCDEEHPYGERVKRPAPKVLDADGVEVKVGDEVWSISGDGPMSVEEIHPSDDPDDPEHIVWCGDKGCELLSDVKIWRIADQLTHRAPVLAADGKPLEVGQTVWNINNGMEFNVSRLPKPGEYQAVEVRHRNGSSTSYDPCRLTHTKPEPSDSWERIEGDARSMLDDGLHPNGEWVLDLLSRAKALAERGK